MAKPPTNAHQTPRESAGEPDRPVCGIVMPISAMDNCSESHWGEVLAILNDVISEAGFEPNLVSNADDVGVIQKRIIQNLYSNPIVVCDVSGRNANVMFELGMRLAFDKATVIIKDDATPFSFDTGPIEHVPYRRDLRFTDIVEFKAKLRDKILATHKAFQKNPDQTAFLKHFGEFKVAHLEQKEVSSQEYIFEELRELRNLITRSARGNWSPDRRPTNAPAGNEIDVCLGGVEGSEDVEKIARLILDLKTVDSIRIVKVGDHSHIFGCGSFPTMVVRDQTESRARAIVTDFSGDLRPMKKITQKPSKPN